MGSTRPADTALAVVPRALYTLCMSYGLSAEWLARRWGIRADGYADADSFVPYAECLALWDALAASNAARPVGVEVGELVGAVDFGIVGLASAQARTLGEALATLCRLQHVIDPTLAVHVEREASQVGVRVVADPRLCLREHPLEAMLVAIQRTAERLVGQALPNPRLEFAHAARGPDARYQRVFGCTPEHTERYRLSWVPGTLELPLVSARPELLGYLTREAELLARQRAEAMLDTRERVRRWILAHRAALGGALEGQEARSLMQKAARSLGRSVRTLQRQLADEGESFRGLLEAVLCERAKLLLEEQSRSVAEVAAALGYREPRSFHRAFKRWNGRTPSEYRASLSGAAR